MKTKLRSVFKSDTGKQLYREAYDLTLTLWPKPFEEIMVPTEYGPTHVIFAGDRQKKPLVLLHSAQASSTMWFPNIEWLTLHHSIYAIDFILEVGKSDLENGMQTRSDLAAWFTDVLNGCELEKPDVVGISRGAWNAIALALKVPERVGKLVLLSPAQTFIPIQHLGFLAATLRCSFFPSKRSIQALSRIVFQDPTMIPASFLHQYALGLRYFNVLNGIYVPPTLFSDAELIRLKKPCLLMIGDKDVINTQKAVARARSLIQDIETEIVQGAGHILTIDRPEYVTKRIIDYLLKI